jgi:HK97 family phage major capsid protein
MFMQSNSAVVLRKIGGRLEACWSSTRRVAGGRTAAAAAPSLLGLIGAFVLMLIPAILLAGALLLATKSSAIAGLALATPPVLVPGAKEIRDEIMAAVTEMRTANDERLKQLEARGTADPLLVAKVEQANAAVTTLAAQLKELETAQARAALTAPVADSKERRTLMARAKEFVALTTGRRIREVKDADVDFAAIEAYARGVDNYLRGAQPQAAMSVGASPEGGYWVSPDRTGRIVEFLYQTSPMRQYADVVTTTKDAKEGWTDLEEFGISKASETGTRAGNTDTADLGKWRIPVHEMYAEPRLTQQMIDDSDEDMEGWTADKSGRKFGREENTWFVNGGGNGEATGFLKYPHASAPTAANWRRIQYTKSGAAADFAAVDPGHKLIDMVHSLKSPLRQGAIWAANNLTIAALRKLKDADGAYLLQIDFSQGFSGQLLGGPVVEFPDMPDIAAGAYPLAYANFKEGYTIVDRLGIRTLRDPLTLKGWVKFYTTKRVGGDVTNFEAIKLLKIEA